MIELNIQSNRIKERLELEEELEEVQIGFEMD